MPSIPIYNQGATEEAGLTRAKRRVIESLESGIAKLTERPDEDITNGKADVIASNLITQFEDLTAFSRQITAYLGNGEETIEFADTEEAVRALKLVILSARAVSRLLRTVKQLIPVMRFMDLGILNDLKAVSKECSQAFYLARDAMTNIDFSRIERNIDRLEDYEDPELSTVLSDWDDISVLGTESINTVGSLSLGTKRTGSTGSTKSKGTKSSSTKSKGKFPPQKNTMLRYMFNAINELSTDQRPMGISLDRPPPSSKPVPRGVRAEADPEIDQAISRGQRLAQQEEEEFQMRQQGKAVLEEVYRQYQEQQEAEDKLIRELNKDRSVKLRAFQRFGADEYNHLVKLLTLRFDEAINLLNSGYRAFNAFRQQRLFPSRSRDVSSEIKSGGVYRIGGSSDLLYKREGLPRFL